MKIWNVFLFYFDIIPIFGGIWGELLSLLFVFNKQKLVKKRGTKLCTELMKRREITVIYKQITQFKRLNWSTLNIQRFIGDHIHITRSSHNFNKLTMQQAFVLFCSYNPNFHLWWMHTGNMDDKWVNKRIFYGKTKCDFQFQTLILSNFSTKVQLAWAKSAGLGSN